MNDASQPYFRKTSQYLAPAQAPPAPAGRYNLYPAFSIEGGKILHGFEALASVIHQHRLAVIDGDAGVAWENLRWRLDVSLAKLGISANFLDISLALNTPAQIGRMLEPYLGGDDPLFGSRFPGRLESFFDPAKLAAVIPDERYPLNVLYGCGAALAGWQSLLLYADVPKNEIQFRMRAGRVSLPGQARQISPRDAYKRMYFVDWPLMNRHKAGLLARLDWFIDEQRPDEPLLISGSDLRAALGDLSQSALRARPWFEPGPWGGQWIQEHVSQLSPDVPNYAWSFELISPENGLLLESGGLLLETPFDLLMLHSNQAVLGDFAEYFGHDFPIRFDFLDTFDGGNLSIQCHPGPDYIRQHFGESFTQDEAYYVLDCQPGARIYLGFQETVDPQSFRQQLELSRREGVPVDIDRFVNSLPSRRHDLLLIPNRTIHGSGKDNLILEISATPYIFTFKLYDWLRLDLDGKPRPLNIERAFENLDFSRSGEYVRRELVSEPALIKQGAGWQIIHLPTHAEHFYDVVRFELEDHLEWETAGSPQVMNLVEGGPIDVHTPNGRSLRLNFAETFVVPAAAGRCRIVNEGPLPAKVVAAFLKPDWFTQPAHGWLKAKTANR